MARSIDLRNVNADFKKDFAGFKYFQRGPHQQAPLKDENRTSYVQEITEGRATRRQATAGGVNHSINLVSRDYGLAAAIDQSAQH